MSLRRQNTAFWNDPAELARIVQGVPPLGGGGDTEVRYRCYEEARTLRSLVEFRPTDHVLELGCGNGRWACELAPGVASYTGVDLSRPLLDQASENCARRDLKNVTFVEASAEDYVPNAEVSVVYLSGISQYLEDDPLMQVVSRMMRSAPRSLIDRSTFHLREREILSAGAYASIYRRHGDFRALLARAGWRFVASSPSYRFFCFPRRFARGLAWPASGRAVEATRPLSYVLLRWSSRLMAMAFRGRSPMADYEHLFSVFGPETGGSDG